ncbi:MAG: bifunctional diaminohydroxyphosphoribosylaminopyrimidine deaminase/5-amino-6-(5-phosphoribosylamino)uracil reductase RibD [Acidimicrobiia bacterium]
MDHQVIDADGDRDRQPVDAAMMGLALAHAAVARRRSAPNPWVGCVLAHGDTVVGAGATQAPGGAHAEIEALADAGRQASGATAYVTLEPCNHHGRTPPCTDVLVGAGVSRVVVAIADPDPHVAGAGIAALRSHGITVDVGVCAAEAERELLPYLVHRREGRAAAVLKLATSLDGRTAAADGSARWITGPEARADVHRLRAESQAVVIGAGTALADGPSLTARDVEPPVEHQPLRVLLDARGRVPARGPLFDQHLAPTLVLTTGAAPDDATAAWLAAGAKVHTLPAGSGTAPRRPTGVDLRAALEHLGGLGVLQALVEPGPMLGAAFVSAGLADRVVVYTAPTFLGTRGRPALDLAGPETIADAEHWRLASVARLGDDVRLDYDTVRLRGRTAGDQR